MTITIRKQVAPHWWRMDESDNQAPEFFIKPLTKIEMLGCRIEVGLDQFERVAITGRGVRQAIGAGLLDWRGVLDESGAPIKFSHADAENLPENVLLAIAWHILSISRLSDEQKKS